MPPLTPEQAAKIDAFVAALPPMSDDAIGRVALIVAAERKRRSRKERAS